MASVTAARVTAPTLLDLVPSFERHLRAENKSRKTVTSYTEAVRRLHDYLAAQGMPVVVASISKEHCDAFQADQLARLKPSSAKVRNASLRQFFKWAIEEGERTSNPMPRPPQVPEHPVPVLSWEHLKALLRTVDHDADFFGRRDAALIRCFIDTGCRLSELSDLKVEDMDLDGKSLVFTGKGGHERVSPIGDKSVRAVDRYLTARAGHRDADSEHLWLGRSGPMSSYGIAEAVKRRAREAAIGEIHVHQLRHSAAHHLRVRGADDDALLRLMGWRDRSTLHRYGASAAEERAREVHHRVGLGDRL